MVSMKQMTAFSLVMVAMAACAPEQPDPEREGAATQPTDGMPGMPGMGGTQMSGQMMEEMEAHLRQVEGASGEQMMAVMSQHRQMVANLISQFNREMREMNMATDQEWNATVEALRADLVRMPEMSPQELLALMPEHRQRVMRLMEMHRGMMGRMGM
ncbi:MAG: hypothetical protein WEG36_01235 [Gemmatimonadota bacterium]